MHDVYYACRRLYKCSATPVVADDCIRRAKSRTCTSSAESVIVFVFLSVLDKAAVVVS